jgi:two-component system, cell cycle sensor histidine kinase and response regulator CckA
MEAKAKILVVEDERIVAEDIRRSLKKLGYEVSAVVSTGRDALRKVRQDPPDLVLMDIVLRMEMNGIQTTEKIHEIHDVPVIYLTAYADEETLERAKKTEPYGYILKPFEDRELQTTIEMALYKHKMQRRIRQNEAWLSTTLKSIAEGVIATNEKTEILFMNPVAETITGRKFSEVSGKSFQSMFEVIHEGRGVVNPVMQALSSRSVVDLSGEAKLVRKNGKVIDVDINASPIRNEIGKVSGVVMAIQDVTHRKLTEEALRKSEQEKRLILSSVSEQVTYHDTQLRIIWANDAVGRYLRMDPEQLKGRHCYEVWHHRRQPCALCPILETLRSGETTERETETEDGWVWLSRVYPVRDDTGQLTGAVEVARDITLQKKTEEQLEKERSFINTLLQTSPAFYVAIDPDGKILLMNQTMLKTLGYTQDEVVGRDYLETFVHPQNRNALNAALNRSVREEEPTFNEIRILTKQGKEISVELYGRSVFDKKGHFEYSFALGLDVTERLRAEKEKERIENQLLQIQKLEAIGTLTGGVAHDFNNLLTAIQGCTDMAILRCKPGDPIYRDLHEIQMAGNRAADLTRQLLLFSSKHPTRVVPIDLNQTIGDLLKMLHRLIGEDIGISTVLHPDLWTVKGDKGTLEQVVMNLTVNARDAMPDGGRITIKTDNVVLDEQYGETVPEGRPGMFVRLSVSDTGVGIDPAVLPRIFEPFFSTKLPGKGTGLGLSVVYGIVRQHSGWITVQSTPGAGSMLDVYLPAGKEKVVRASDQRVSLEGLRGNGERILAVEDAEGVQEFLRSALSENGYIVFIASNSTEALSIFRKHRGRFDLIFSDVVLPDKSGIELVEILQKENPDLNILLSSGYTDHKSQWTVIQNRRYPFIHKPFSLYDLLKTVKEMITKEKK